MMPQSGTSTSTVYCRICVFVPSVERTETRKRDRRVQHFINLIIQQCSHYNINTALLVTGSNNPNILYSYFVIHYQEALPVSLAIEELQYCV